MPNEPDKNRGDAAFIDIAPVAKGRRILAYLADFFIAFIFALSLFHMAVLPSGKAISHFNDRIAESSLAADKRDSVLYGNGLLFPSDPDKWGSEYFRRNLAHTYEVYLKSLVLGSGEGSEVFRHYYIDIKNDIPGFQNFYKELDTKTSFFDIGDSSSALKSIYVEEWKPYFDPKDTMSTKGGNDLNRFRDKIFLLGYSRLLGDIGKNDLTYDGVSYVAMQRQVALIAKLESDVVSACAGIAMLLGIAINFALVPLLNRHRKTIGMMALRLERVNATSLTLEKRRNIPVHFAYGFLFNLGLLVFVPWGSVGFNELFALPWLFPISLVSLAAVLVSFFFMMFDPYDRALSDLISFSVLLDGDDFSKVLRAQGKGC